ncbi:uncharacterized protein [Euphorbia lathyris]|uniref:uncharacterized protein n=1 Tax=Euphorbia lathyris TaxID=212925 RepID=UPI0033136ADB
MDEDEFQRVLHMFPVVRSRDYHIDLDPSRQSTSRSPVPVPVPQDEVHKWQDAWDEEDQKKTENEASYDRQEDAFWGKLKSVAERKLGPADAKRFCDAFQRVHRQLVYKELSLDAARSLLNSIRTSG